MLGAERLDAGTVLWAAGVAASPLVRTLGVPLDRAGRVIVEPDCRFPAIPRCSSSAMPRRSSPGRQAAAGRRAGGDAGGGACRANDPRRVRGAASTPFVYHDKGNMAIVGRGSAIADLGWIRFSGTTAWLAWLFLHIFMLIGFRNRLVVLLQWAVAYVTFQRSVRLITNVDRSDPLRLPSVSTSSPLAKSRGRLDAGGTSGRNISRDTGHEADEHRDTRDRRGVVAADAVQDRFEPAAEERGDRRAANHADERHHRALEQDGSEHDTLGRAERHPDADFAGTLHHVGRDDAVQADRGQQQADAANPTNSAAVTRERASGSDE